MKQSMEARYGYEGSQHEELSYARESPLPLYGQKAQEQKPPFRELPTPTQRLTLAIFSILLLSLLSIIALAIVGSRTADPNINNPFFFAILGIILLLLFTATVIINVVFNRR